MATEPTPGWTPRELMACAAARQLGDGEVVFVGIGLPNLACNLARRLHAPNLVLVGEAGTVKVLTRWKDRDGKPTMVEASHVVEKPAEPAGEAATATDEPPAEPT